MHPQIGGIFFDPGFRFPDGNRGEKLFIILGVGHSDDYVVARTTSNPTHKSWTYGCHSDEADPNFFIPASAKIFPKDTWVCLDYLSDFDVQEFDRKVASSAIRKKDDLPQSVLKDLLGCAAGADDTTQAQVKVLRDTLAELP